jgi:hypothetical protein
MATSIQAQPINHKQVIGLIDQLTKELSNLRVQAAQSAGCVSAAVVRAVASTPGLPPSPLAVSKVAHDLQTHPGSTRAAVARRTRLHPRTAGKAFAALVDQGRAVRAGAKRGSRWFLSSSLDALHSTEH